MACSFDFAECSPPPRHEDGTAPLAAAGREYLWGVGEPIRIAFMLSSPKLADAVETVKLVAEQWTVYANVDFDWVPVDHASDVRIMITDSPDPSGRAGYSALGNRARDVPQSEPTMCFFLKRKPGSRISKGTILHEFGHMLGLHHEHQALGHFGVRWNWEALRRDFPLWKADDIRKHITEAMPGVSYSDGFDAHSVMTYPIKLDWSERGSAGTLGSYLSLTGFSRPTNSICSVWQNYGEEE